MNCEIITVNTVAGMKNPLIEKADVEIFLSISSYFSKCLQIQEFKNLDPQYEELSVFVLDIYLIIGYLWHI